MFTGLVEEKGIVKNLHRGTKSAVLTISGQKIFDDLAIGDSVAVNGVCLTVTEIAGQNFKVDVMNETLLRSSLGNLFSGSYVNLERAMAANGRFGGHIVSGHIDGVGVIKSIRPDDIAVRYVISADPQIMQYIVQKGSVALDGISLTVSNVWQDSFEVSVIPHTAKSTILSEKTVGSLLNIENDIIGKYIKRFLSAEDKKEQNSSGITEEFLLRNGF
jgi:riboflavin synthase